MPHLFEPFYRGSVGTGGEQKDGLGLGLFIVSEIVNLHGGRIEITSVLRNGTSIRITFPRI